MTPLHLILVAGPSGGGKSTFIRQLAAKTLAPDIMACLPEQGGGWPTVEANNVLKGSLARETLLRDMCRTGEWLVHYDIVFIHCYGLKSYQDDPVMELLTGADVLDVVFVRPAGDVLRRQFGDRQVRHHQTKSKASLLWGRWFRRPLRRVLAPWTGKAVCTTAELYARDHWLADCYSQWETFCQHLVKRHPHATLTVVEPTSGPGAAAFRLVSHCDRQSPTVSPPHA